MKQGIKRLLSAALVLFLALSLPVFVPAANAAGAGTQSDPWDISADGGAVQAWIEGGKLFVSGEGRMTDSFRDVAPPWDSVKETITEVEIGEGVTNVGAYAFNFCANLTTVALPEGLTEIGTYAFNFTKVKRLVIPASVAALGRMIANSTTYFEVLGNPETVDNHAFTTSLVSVKDQGTAEALNGKTNVGAIIVLNGGIYGSDLANLSYGLTAPTKEGYTFGGWYLNAGFSGQPCPVGSKNRTTTNINTIYYAKWTEGTTEPDPEPVIWNVIWKNADGTVLGSAAFEAGGDEPAYTGDTPAKAEDAEYTYEFDGWDRVEDAGTRTITYTARYKAVPKGDGPDPDKPGPVDPTPTPTPTPTPGTPTTPGTGSTGTPSTPDEPDTTTTVTENPDGSITTTVTDNVTGTVVTTTEYPDGGTVETVAAPGQGVTITVTSPGGETLAEVEIPAVIPAPDGKFEDVPDGHWAEEAINQAVGLGLVNGVSDTLFDLNGYMKRGDLAVILFRLSNGDPTLSLRFTDVSSGMYYAAGIAWADHTGVVTGYNETTFGPEDTITREQLAVMLYRYAQLLRLDTETSADNVLGAFADNGNTSAWAKDGMAWCVEKGIIQGKSGGILDPAGITTRAEVVVMLQRLLSLMK